MKTKLLSLMAFTLFSSLYSQVNFDPHFIMGDPSNSAKSIYASDLDNDGDKDLLVAYDEERKIKWFEFNNELKVFDVEHVLAEYVFSGRAVYTSDLDNDQDEDAIGADASRIFWFENIDNQGNFGNEQIITTDIVEPTSVFAIDMDGDGDSDILASSLGDPITQDPPVIAWFENSDGLGNFTAKHIIDNSNNIELYSRIYFADLDNDSDPDVIITNPSYGNLGWYKNLDGHGNFSSFQLISNNTPGASSVFSADINLDGNNDIIVAIPYDNKIAWYENINGQGIFGPQNIITTEVDFPRSVYGADFDNDGDIDIISASNSKIASYENTDGLGNFGPQNVILTSSEYPFVLYTSDIEGDGDIDAISVSFGQNELFWFENQFILEVKDFSNNLFSLYPNPTNDLVNIKSKTPISEISVYNNLGQLLFTLENTNQVDISSVNKGIYLLKIVGADGYVEAKKMVKK